jgi:hypothetical protein
LHGEVIDQYANNATAAAAAARAMASPALVARAVSNRKSGSANFLHVHARKRKPSPCAASEAVTDVDDNATLVAAELRDADEITLVDEPVAQRDEARRPSTYLLPKQTHEQEVSQEPLRAVAGYSALPGGGRQANLQRARVLLWVENQNRITA